MHAAQLFTSSLPNHAGINGEHIFGICEPLYVVYTLSIEVCVVT